MTSEELDQHLRNLERALRARAARVKAAEREGEAVKDLKARTPTSTHPYRLPFLK